MRSVRRLWRLFSSRLGCWLVSTNLQMWLRNLNLHDSYPSIMKAEPTSSSEKSAKLHSTQCHIPEDAIVIFAAMRTSNLTYWGAQKHRINVLTSVSLSPSPPPAGFRTYKFMQNTQPVSRVSLLCFLEHEAVKKFGIFTFGHFNYKNYNFHHCNTV